MSTNGHSTEPLAVAELDQLDALNRARTPGPLDVLPWPGDGEGYAVAEVDGWIVRSCSAERAPAADDARAIAAALNALPALLAEVRAARAALRFDDHVRAHDDEGRGVHGWIVALDAAGRVQLDIVTGAGMPSGRHSEWLSNPERCPVYKTSTFRYFSASADDGTGDVIDQYGRRPGP